MKKIISVVLALTMIFGMTMLASAVDGSFVISENGEYTYTGTDPIVVKSGVTATLTISGVNIQATACSALTVESGAELTLILAGENILKGDLNTNVSNAGIYVPVGAKLTIDGNGSLEAYAGFYGAGIGSVHHQSSGDIVINDGTISAFGSNGAGIGSGYGTSGGSTENLVGQLNGGNITINGGDIFAAAFTLDKDLVSTTDLAWLNTLKGGCFGAGIGGGYGASSGNISITGGKVVAIGSCGGAGIGSGRGTSSAKKYDQSAFAVNISISGDAEVIAFGGDDYRDTHGGGAAIGSGRGTHTGGNISITGNAKVTAIASRDASAIGTATGYKNPLGTTVPAYTDNIIIGENVTLLAMSNGTKYAVDTDCGNKSFNGITADVQQVLFGADVLNVNGATEFDVLKGTEVVDTLVIPEGFKSVAFTCPTSGTYYLKQASMFGTDSADVYEYTVNGALSEQSCVKLSDVEIEEEFENVIAEGSTVKVLEYIPATNTYRVGTMQLIDHSAPAADAIVHYLVLDETTFVANDGNATDADKAKIANIADKTNDAFAYRKRDVNMYYFGRVDSNAAEYALTIAPYVAPYLDDVDTMWLSWGNRKGTTTNVWMIID